jgi:signal transduction histidine kinase/HAMP domain-containing protein
MKLGTKLVLAQVPLVLALLVTIVVGNVVTRDLGRGAARILRDNYRSVLAAQRMKEAIERMDSAVMFVIAGEAARGQAQLAANRARFEAELAVQEANITEPGERELTAALRARWGEYQAQVAGVATLPPPALRDRYFAALLPAFTAVKDAADAVLDKNQDAMLAKSDQAERLGTRSNTWLVVVSVVGLVLGLIASSTITSRVLRPLAVLGQTARRLGEGDVAVRARVDGKDEIAALAGELNTMAERIQRYRQSSLGELLEAQLAAQATIDSLPDPVLVIGTDGTLTQVNQAAEAVLRVKAEGSLAALEPAARAVIERITAHVASGRGAYVPKGLDEAIGVATSDGERRFLPRAAPVYAEAGGVTGTTVVFQDVTRLLRFEELRNNLVATVAHEFRTPLTSLRMAIHLLAEETVGPLTAKQADLAFACREDCERLQAIVDELLDLSRISAGRVELRRVPTDPEALITAALDAARGAATARQVDLRAEVLPGLPALDVDPDRLQLVLANLIGNAVRHSPAGAAVTVRAVPGPGALRLEVADRGPGVPAEYHQAIFEKYVRVPGGVPGGAGLGLFIARELIHAHGGEIGVDSVAGEGATFWCRLPSKRAAETEAASS